ncbi:MAG: hypothetical protein BWY23_00148 [Spirochaetes bacterium ADurb.Bin218]|nr:MAG: hypothetical protein BWY23_00148 [Spirochaetes bacterium ADurb.Bin218]HOV09697.1 hypothetical protein [Spirochaetota bacterium]
MELVREELKKISHFLVILAGLYIVNFIFNMMYDWGGVSVIVRVYIMVLSCYVVYNFSQIDVEHEKELYREQYGTLGVIYLFILVRFFPFFFIYIMTLIFALINYAGSTDWPYDTLLRLLDGRYSNTVIYALFLFIILRLKIPPGISIPLFLSVSMLYFYTDKLLYNIFDPGFGISVIKTAKFMVFFCILIYGYSKNRLRTIHALMAGMISGLVSFTFIVGIFFSVFYFSDKSTKSYSFSARTLLKYGFSSIFTDYETSVKNHKFYSDISDLIVFSKKFGYEINMPDNLWIDFILYGKGTYSEDVVSYLLDRKIFLDFNLVADVVRGFSEESPEILLNSKKFKSYFSNYYDIHENDFYSLYKNGNIHLKKFIIDSLAYIKDYRSLIFLIDKLTDVNVALAERAYDSLKKITGYNPAREYGKPYYDVDVIESFRSYASKIKSKGF